MKININKITKDMGIITALPDKPTINSTQLKQKFDEAGQSIKSYINDSVVDAINEVEIPIISNNINDVDVDKVPNTITVKDYVTSKTDARQKQIIITNVVPTDSDGEEGDIWLVWS